MKDLTNVIQIFRYREKSLQQKLEILYQRNLYVLAINLAQKIGVETLQQNAIYRKYGDFLYQKGDYDTAMQQYLRAIDNTEPSQVIRKVWHLGSHDSRVSDLNSTLIPNEYII